MKHVGPIRKYEEWNSFSAAEHQVTNLRWETSFPIAIWNVDTEKQLQGPLRTEHEEIAAICILLWAYRYNGIIIPYKPSRHTRLWEWNNAVEWVAVQPRIQEVLGLNIDHVAGYPEYSFL